MSYLDNSTRISKLMIGSRDFTSSFISFSVSDTSAYKAGCISTTGSLILGSEPGGYDIRDYDRNAFRRGTVVILDVEEPSGASFRHPRGYLYVMSCDYNVESAELEIEVACKVALAALTDKIEELEALSPIVLDTAQKTFSNVSASFASGSEFVYQDNSGRLQTGKYFGGDSTGGTTAGEWVSILGVTTRSVKPLAGFSAIPDQIELSYQVPIDDDEDEEKDRRGYIDTVIDDSQYFTGFPATIYTRNNKDDKELVEVEVEAGTSVGGSSGCGNTPPPPNGSTTEEIAVACITLYDASQQTEYIPARRRVTTTTYYDAPGAQVSRITSTSTGMPIEVNPQYYADDFAYCRAVYASQCNPNGGCPYGGINSQIVAKSETINEYGEANELVRSTTDTYALTLNAAQPADWRAGVSGGIPRVYNNGLDTTSLYRAQRRVVSYKEEGSSNIQTTETWTSMASRGVGLRGPNLDALSGIKTTQTRTSTTTAPLDIAPDRVNSATTKTKEETEKLMLGTRSFSTPPTEAGPYILQESIPVPLLSGNVKKLVEDYSNYLVRFIKGDIYGIQIGEGLRKSMAGKWTPNMPFRYYDPSAGVLMALRMDQTSWYVGQRDCVFATTGLWIGYSNGRVSIPENLVGNSMPDMTNPSNPTPIPPKDPDPEPIVEDETAVDIGSLEFWVDQSFYFGVGIFDPGADGVLPPPPSPDTINTSYGWAPYITGFIVGPGSLLSPEPGGNIPFDSGNGQLIVEGGTLIDANLFAS